MKQSFIKLHENDNGDIVITYIGDADFHEQITPDVLVIRREDMGLLSKLLKAFKNEVSNG